jgi:hypothetical protein
MLQAIFLSTLSQAVLRFLVAPVAKSIASTVILVNQIGEVATAIAASLRKSLSSFANCTVALVSSVNYLNKLIVI